MKSIVKYFFYHVICPLLLFFGLDKFLRRMSSKRCLIIMYHGVSKKKNFSINGRHLPLDEFEKHLKYFKRHFDILSLPEICAQHNGKRSKYSVALTFDDGYLNNIQNAMPLLLKYKIPATFFISTISLTEHEYIHPSDYIDLISKSTSDSVDINGKPFAHRDGQLRNSDISAYTYINSLSFKEFKLTFTTLRNRYPLINVLKGIDPEVHKLVTAEAVAELASEKIFAVGSHSHDHVNLNMLSPEDLDHQLSVSKKLLEKQIQDTVDCIAFPYGYFSKAVVERSSQHGYKYLLAGGIVAAEWKHHVFPRIGILNMAGYSFNMLSINRGFRNFGF